MAHLAVTCCGHLRAFCRQHLQTVGEEEVNAVALTALSFLTTLRAFMDMAEEILQHECPTLEEFVHHVQDEAIDLVGASALSDYGYFSTGSTDWSPDCGAEEEALLCELRDRRRSLAQWRADLDQVTAVRFDRLVGGIRGSGLLLYDMAPVLFFQLLTEQFTALNAEVNQELVRRASSRAPRPRTLSYPSGGSSGTALTQEAVTRMAD